MYKIFIKIFFLIILFFCGISSANDKIVYIDVEYIMANSIAGKEIFSKLSGAEKRLLGALAVFREPMPLEALSGHDLETDLLDDLVEKGLARQADSEMYDVHDLIREFLTRSLDIGTNNELHAKAVEWYRTRRNNN